MKTSEIRDTEESKGLEFPDMSRSKLQESHRAISKVRGSSFLS